MDRAPDHVLTWAEAQRAIADYIGKHWPERDGLRCQVHLCEPLPVEGFALSESRLTVGVWLSPAEAED